MQLCTRCAIRLSIARSHARTSTKRSFASTAERRRAGPLPKFTETSQPALDDILASLRHKHLVPAALSNTERNLIYKTKHQQRLIEHPVVATIGDEDVELQHINRLSDVPSLKKDIIPKAITLMSKGEPRDWNQLPAMLEGLKKAKMTPRYSVMAKIARKAIESGRFGIILQCLQMASTTDMTLRKPEVLHNVLYGLRQIAHDSEWSEEATARAIRDASEVAMLLEDEEHGSGKFVRSGDPRTQPHLLAVFLELSAVHAFKYQDGQDVDGKVKAYAERLLSNMEAIRILPVMSAESGEPTGSEKTEDPAALARIKACIQPSTTTPQPSGPQTEILKGVPIWHGLRLAQKVLGDDMPRASLAQEAIEHWGEGLEKLTEGLKRQVKKDGRVLNRAPKTGTYDWQALNVWTSCLRIEE